MKRRRESTEAVLADARAAGIDLDLLDTNLRLPVKERWRQHDAALPLVPKLEAAKRKHDSGFQRAEDLIAATDAMNRPKDALAAKELRTIVAKERRRR